MTTLAIGSLFSGIGGLDLGLECALRDGGFDVSTIWQCEQDAWCCGILARHWPDALRYDDVRNVSADAPRIDILCGGFPCQDVSVAGKGAGLAGARSGLWYEFARIARELRPRIVVVENVAALLSRGLDTVLGDLSEAGYDALWFDLRASDVGAPHQRERLFIVAWRRDVGDGAGARREGLAGSDGAGAGRVSGVAADAGTHMADAGGGEGGQRPDADVLRRRARDTEQTRVGDRAGVRDARGRVAESDVGGAVDGLPRRVDITAHRWPAGPGEAQREGEAPRVTTERRQLGQRLKALGNAVVPQQAYVVGCVVAEVLLALALRP